MARHKCVAIAMDLFQPFEWHHKTYAGALRYSREIGGWQCVIDEFPEVTLPPSRTRKMPYDGIIARATKATAEAASRVGIPLVNVWLNSPVRGLPGVHTDAAAAGALCAEHLLGRGFRRFGYLIQPGDKSQKLELRALTARVAERGYTCSHALIPRVNSGQVERWSAMQQAIKTWLDSLAPPVGICVKEPHMARQVEHLCLNRGWRVPQEVAILCTSNENTICNYPDPALSSIDSNWDLIGFEAAKLLDGLMRGDPAPAGPILLPPVGILQRASTDFFAVEDPLVSEALRYIAAHLNKPIDVSDVVAAVGTSRSTLERSFREHMDLPISKEIMRLRLERVKRHLTENKKARLKFIAHESGFADATTLCRVFSRELGITPGQYRNQISVNPREESE